MRVARVARRIGLSARVVAASIFVLLLAGNAGARVDSTKPAGLLIMPALFTAERVDTEIQISNTAAEPVHVRCYLVNANSHCSDAPTQVCRLNEECGGAFCLPGWTETDFRFTLTHHQPIVWRLGQGLQSFPLDGLNRVGQDGQFNADSNIPPAPEEPFIGELKCFQVDADDSPVARNDLIGTVTVVDLLSSVNTVDQYNAVGVQATDVNDGDDTLCLGGAEPTEECPEPEYEGCPNVLILNHFFYNAPNSVTGDPVQTDLILVPCSEDFLNQSTVKSTIQFLIFNEYEQRFSASIRVDCFLDVELANIDTRPTTEEDDDFSIFSFAVQGTLTGQTRIRPIQTDETHVGHGYVGVAEEFYIGEGTNTAAFQLHEVGERTQGDIIRAPRQ